MVDAKDYMDICEKLSSENAALKDRIATLEAQLYVHEWMPIETAPTSASFLAASFDELGNYDSIDWLSFDGEMFFNLNSCNEARIGENGFTYWRPLPPQSSDTAEG
jgi:hypothetical protein